MATFLCTIVFCYYLMACNSNSCRLGVWQCYGFAGCLLAVSRVCWLQRVGAQKVGPWYVRPFVNRTASIFGWRHFYSAYVIGYTATQMLLLTHIIIAILSVLQATYALFAPTRAKMYAAYGLVLATLATGTALVWQLHVALMQPCISGLLYLSILAGLLLGANYRLRLVNRTKRTTGWSQYLSN